MWLSTISMLLQRRCNKMWTEAGVGNIRFGGQEGSRYELIFLSFHIDERYFQLVIFSYLIRVLQIKRGGMWRKEVATV